MGISARSAQGLANGEPMWTLFDRMKGEELDALEYYAKELLSKYPGRFKIINIKKK